MSRSVPEHVADVIAEPPAVHGNPDSADVANGTRTGTAS